MDISGPLPFGDPPLGFRFGVFFFAGGTVPNPIDSLFQKVSGIGSTVTTKPMEEGGQNVYAQLLPQKIAYDNLVLERGLVVASPLGLEFDVAMSEFKFNPSNVLVTLLNEAKLPLASWLFLRAYPVKWSVSGLDATTSGVVIETMELVYQRMQAIRL